jgi:hypothetical protein
MYALVPMTFTHCAGVKLTISPNEHWVVSGPFSLYPRRIVTAERGKRYLHQEDVKYIELTPEEVALLGD